MIWCASVKVVGHHGNRYGPEWVNRLHAAMARKLPRMDIRHVCLTDDASGIEPHIQTIDIGPWWREWKDYTRGLYHPIGGWWAKVKLFEENLIGRSGDRILYSDLDNLIVGDLNSLPCGYHHLYILADSAANKTAKPGVIRKFNSSLMTWAAGKNPQIYHRFGEAALKNFRSDQDWIAHLYPGSVTFPVHMSERLSACIDDGPQPGTRVVLCIKPKNDEAAKRSEWVRKAWQ